MSDNHSHKTINDPELHQLLMKEQVKKQKRRETRIKELREEMASKSS